MSDEEQFEQAQIDSPDTVRKDAGSIKKGGFMIIKDRPVKIAEVNTSKAGKHGHAKCHFVGIDIFTGQKMEDLVPSSHSVLVPNVKRTECLVLQITDEGCLSLLDEVSGETREDLKLPDDPDVANILREGVESGYETMAVVIEAMGEAKVDSVRVLDAVRVRVK
jgi:translation initiation factor 5A